MLLCGCAHQIQREVPVAQPTTHVFKKNYSLGEVRTAAVGEPLIQVKDYFVTKYELPVMSPVINFAIDGPMLHEAFSPNQKFEIKGKISLNDVYYSVVPFKFGANGAYSALLIKEDGSVHTTVGAYNNQLSGVVPVLYTYQITPDTATMKRLEEEKVVADKGYQNYEILYNGTDKNSMLFTYREFSPDGIARTAFYQNLTYEANATSIRFKGFKINILKSNNEEVKFSVIQDGL